MFSLSQYLVIGFAGSVYVVGTALLLTEHTFLRSSGLSPFDASEQGTAEVSGGVKGSPYFVPVFEEVVLTSGVPEDPRSYAGGEQLRAVRGDLSIDHQTAEHENEELLLLAEPICLN